MTRCFSILLTILAYTLLSTGFVFMKKGIVWIGYKGEKDKTYYRNLFTWISGFLLINIFIVPNTVALRYLDPHIVSSIAGWGVVFMVFLSHALLKEKLYSSDFSYSVLIFISIIFLNLYENQEGGMTVNIPLLTIMASLPFFLFAPVFINSISKRIKTIIYAAVSGISTGMIIVTMKVLVSLRGFHVGSYFSSPYLYLYLLFSLTAFISLQVAYKKGVMMLVGPVQYSAAIIYPVLCSYLVFSNRINFIQLAAISAIVYSVIAILKKH